MRNCEEDTLDDMDESLLEPIVMVYQMSQMKESDIDEKAFTGKMGTDGTQVDMKQLMQALATGQVPDQPFRNITYGPPEPRCLVLRC